MNFGDSDLTKRSYSAVSEFEERIKRALYPGNVNFERIERMDPDRMQKLLLWRVISKECSFDSSIWFDAKSGAGIMLNEEDEIRLFCIRENYSLDNAYKTASELRYSIKKNEFGILFNNDLGYLNRSIYNIGTGMRASVMIGLPFLTITGNIGETKKLLRSKGLMLRGNSGEGSAADRFYYQLSNISCACCGEKECIGVVKYGVEIASYYEKRAMRKCENGKAEFAVLFKNALRRLYTTDQIDNTLLNELLVLTNIAEKLGLIKTDIRDYEKLYLKLRNSLKTNGNIFEETKRSIDAEYVKEVIEKEIKIDL